MRFIILLPLLLGLFFMAHAAEPAPTPLRVLIISAPAPTSAEYRVQAALLLPAWSGLIERDFMIQTRFEGRPFSVSLIGKDGGEKLHRQQPVTPEEIFALVDTMPMRRAEMLERK